MKVILLFLAAISVCYGCNSKKETSSSENDLPSAAIQIKSALLAAPLEKRDSCTVYGYSADTQLVLLRKGTNELICLADDPKVPDFSVACYVRDLEPFMQRGRELRKQGINGQQVFDEREKEVIAGTLQMPKQPATLYVYSAKDKDFDRATGEVKNGYLRYVIYIPYATAASTGLPEKPSADGMPWIMDPGTHGAHIMINP
ncbi:hypothetical protein [Terrimonas pollutisoli]|uniref:hypothetical protein n=1 Tax=Terrimonas pollutisoli TaxID=3034147 RepID=UPI0023EAD190|nr:hypothetical protein [Terrimonas sp. H1YJ31]